MLKMMCEESKHINKSLGGFRQILDKIKEYKIEVENFKFIYSLSGLCSSGTGQYNFL